MGHGRIRRTGRKLRWGSLLAWSVISLIVGSVVIYAAGPIFLEMQLQTTLKRLFAEHASAGDVTLRNVRLDWTGHLEMDGFRYVPRGAARPAFSVERVTADLSPRDLARGRYVGHLEFVRPEIFLDDESAEPDRPARAPWLPSPDVYVDLSASVRDGRVTVRENGSETSIGGISLTEDFRTGAGNLLRLRGALTAHREPEGAESSPLTLSHDLSLSTTGLEIREAKFVSWALRGQVSGRIDFQDGRLIARDLKGSFSYAAAELLQILAPARAREFSGHEPGDARFRISGPIDRSTLDDLLREGTGEVRLDTGTFSVGGLRGKIAADGAFGDGQGRLHGRLKLNEGSGEFECGRSAAEARTGGRTRLTLRLQGVRTAPELGPVLAALSPLLRPDPASSPGRLDLALEGSWGTAGADRSRKPDRWTEIVAAEGTLAVRGVALEDTPLGRILADALGEKPGSVGDLLPCRVVVGQGRCEYSNLTLRLPRAIVRMTGHVEASGGLRLRVELPLTERLAAGRPALHGHLGAPLIFSVTGTGDAPEVNLPAALDALERRLRDEAPGVK